MNGDGVRRRRWITECPECGLAAEASDEGEVQSTDGAVGLVRLRCVGRHWFLMPADRLPAADHQPVILRPVRR